MLIKQWRKHHNTAKQYGALGYRLPIPQTMTLYRDDLPFALDGLRAERHSPISTTGLNWRMALTVAADQKIKRGTA